MSWNGLHDIGKRSFYHVGKDLIYNHDFLFRSHDSRSHDSRSFHRNRCHDCRSRSQC